METDWRIAGESAGDWWKKRPPVDAVLLGGQADGAPLSFRGGVVALAAAQRRTSNYLFKVDKRLAAN